MPFIRATYEMVNNPENADSVGWGQNGTVLEIRRVSTLCEQVLPKYFTHNNLSSFVRQLNMYGFEKREGAGPHVSHAFFHPNFVRRRGPPRR